MAAVHPGNAVMTGQLFVEERRARRQQLHDAPIRLQLIVEEQLGFLDEGAPQIVVEPRKLPVHIGRQQPDVAGLQPLTEEVVHQRGACARVGEHPPHLPVEHARIAECPAHRDAEQFIVRDAAPQEERQA